MGIIARGASRQFGSSVGVCILRPLAFAGSLLGFTFLLIEALLVTLFRGPSYIRWVRPSRCDDLNSWVTAEWRYYGRGGVQVGTRKFGLEVARKGHISDRHPLL
ncbi:MAG: hypothetical protein JWM42_367 [Burkholderia sp.]|nr:hypothetical protein [Burkholderia sp.]